MIPHSLERRRPRAWWLYLAAVLALSTAARAADPVVTSSWRSSDMVVDGSTSDWSSLDVLEHGPAIGATNDERFLYLIVSASDPQLRRQLGSGLIVWFDPQRKKAKTFGIRVSGPRGAAFGGRRMGGVGSSAVTSMAADPDRTAKDRIDEFDFLGPGKNERHLVTLEPNLGVELATTMQEEALTYEVKIPLEKTEAFRYGLGVAPGATLALGLATPEPAEGSGQPRGGFRGGFDEGPRYQIGGGFGGPRGGGGGPRGGGRSGGQSFKGETSPLSIWLTLKLAAAGGR